MRRWMAAGNWKMNTLTGEARSLASQIAAGTRGITSGEIVLAPPFTALAAVREAIAGSPVLLGAQNMYHESKGAFTGEIAPPMLQDAGVTHVILGHSERRKYFCETDDAINQKVLTSVEVGLTPILCVGETEEQRETAITEHVIAIQIRKGLKGLSPGNLEKVIIAYEPVWAIGTGKNATPDQAEEVHSFIRHLIVSTFGKSGEMTRILYGGSVTADNIGSLAEKNNIDGALVGGAALKAENFNSILHTLSEKRQ